MFRTLGRIAAAVAFLVATVAIATVATNSTAGAANTAVTANCSASASPQTINNSDTITFTIGTGCGAVILMAGSGSSGSAVWTQLPLTLQTGSPIGGLSQGNTVVFTAPASGSGSMSLGFMANAQSPPQITFTVNYPTQAPPTPRNDSIVDNGNGSMTITYDPTSPNENMWVSIFPSGTTCASVPASPTGRVYVLTPDAPYSPIGASPVVVAAGSPAMTGVSPYASATIAAGSYQACMYFSLNGQGTLVQALPITFSEVAPTPDPVAPAFTG